MQILLQLLGRLLLLLLPYADCPVDARRPYRSGPRESVVCRVRRLDREPGFPRSASRRHRFDSGGPAPVTAVRSAGAAHSAERHARTRIDLTSLRHSCTVVRPVAPSPSLPHRPSTGARVNGGGQLCRSGPLPVQVHKPPRTTVASTMVGRQRQRGTLAHKTRPNPQRPRSLPESAGCQRAGRRRGRTRCICPIRVRAPPLLRDRSQSSVLTAASSRARASDLSRRTATPRDDDCGWTRRSVA